MGEKAKRNTTGLRNLADLPPDVRREIQSRGGKASAAKRKEAKMVREALLELLTKPSRSTKGKGNACKTSYDLKSLEDALNDSNNTTVMVQILVPYIQKAKEGDVGEACASILLDDDRAEEIRAAFNENRKAAATYIMRERAIGFCWSCEHLRGRGFIEGSIKSVQVEDI